MSKGAHKYLIDRAVQPNVLSIFFWSVHIIHLILWNMLRFFNPVLWLSSYETIVATIVTIMAGLKEKVWLPFFKLPTPLCDISGRLLLASLCFCKINSLLLGQMERKPSPFGKTDSELLVGTGLWVLLKYKQTFSFNKLGLHSFQTSDSILIQRLWRYISGMKNWLLYTTKFYLWFFFLAK